MTFHLMDARYGCVRTSVLERGICFGSYANDPLAIWLQAIGENNARQSCKHYCIRSKGVAHGRTFVPLICEASPMPRADL